MARLKLIGVYLRLSILNEMAYRANFYTSLLQGIVSLVLAVGGLALVYSHTDTLAGWNSSELLVLVGVFFIMSGFIQTFVQPSMEQFLQDVRKGTLDFTLTKPEDSQLLISVRVVAIWNIIYLLLGVGLVIVALIRGGVALSLGQILLFVVTLALGAVIVYSFWLMLATIAFWFVKVDNILVIFQSVYQAGRWPVAIYPPFLRVLLTFLVPVAFAVTVPAEALTGRLNGTTLIFAVALAAGIFAAARLFWRYGVRHYSGASA